MSLIPLIIHWNPSPEIFKIGAFALRYYSLLFLLAFVVSYIVLAKVFDKEKKPRELLDNLTIYILVGTMAGARIGHCLFYDFSYYSQHPWEIILPFSTVNGNFEFTGFQGLASHGAAIGILIGALLFCRKYKQNIWWLLDRLVIVVASSAFFIRMGNFFNSEIIGKPTDVSWAVVFEREDMLPRHPTQLYEGFCYLVIFVILLNVYRKYAAKVRGGFIFGLFLIMLFTVRFFVEFLKENQEPFEAAMLFNMGQTLSLPFIAAGIYLVATRSRQSSTLKQ